MSERELSQLYQEVLLEHSREPRNFGPMASAQISHEGYNPLCGDRVVVELLKDPSGQSISKIQFHGEGCSICMASASMMTEEVENQPIAQVLEKVESFRDLMAGKFPEGEIPESLQEGEISALAGVQRFPVRIKCALLPWMTLKEALAKENGP